MPELTIIDRAGERRTVDAQIGMSVMEVIRDSGFDELLALCGGCCSCATCHVYIAGDVAGSLPPMSQDEDELLDSSGARTAASRLSCQLQVNYRLDHLEFIIAPED